MSVLADTGIYFIFYSFSFSKMATVGIQRSRCNVLSNKKWIDGYVYIRTWVHRRRCFNECIENHVKEVSGWKHPDTPVSQMGARVPCKMAVACVDRLQVHETTGHCHVTSTVLFKKEPSIRKGIQLLVCLCCYSLGTKEKDERERERNTRLWKERRVGREKGKLCGQNRMWVATGRRCRDVSLGDSRVTHLLSFLLLLFPALSCSSNHHLHHSFSLFILCFFFSF